MRLSVDLFGVVYVVYRERLNYQLSATTRNGDCLMNLLCVEQRRTMYLL